MIRVVNPDPRNADFDCFVSKLDVDIRLTLEKPEQDSRVAYQPNARVILMPPFELFFSAADYYLSLAHELIHWADDSTAVGGVRARPRHRDPRMAGAGGRVRRRVRLRQDGR